MLIQIDEKPVSDARLIEENEAYMTGMGAAVQNALTPIPTRILDGPAKTERYPSSRVLFDKRPARSYPAHSAGVHDVRKRLAKPLHVGHGILRRVDQAVPGGSRSTRMSCNPMPSPGPPNPLGKSMAVEAMKIDVDGHALVLSTERAAFDPRSMSLFVADAHFGKDAVFRARGIPVPAGTTSESLAHLNSLIATHKPESVVFLGNLLHARESHADETLGALDAWRAKHRALRLVLVEGNHDRHAGARPESFGIERSGSARVRFAIIRSRWTGPTRSRARATSIRCTGWRRASTACSCRASASARARAYCRSSAGSPAVSK